MSIRVGLLILDRRVISPGEQVCALQTERGWLTCNVLDPIHESYPRIDADLVRYLGRNFYESFEDAQQAWLRRYGA